MQRVEASAGSDGTASELKQTAAVGGCGIIEVVELECLQRVALKSELPQWPLLQLVQVAEILNGEVLETLLVANGLSKVLKYLVDYNRRRAPEASTNVDIIRRFCLHSHPIIYSVCSVLCEAVVHLYLVQLDPTLIDVLWALRDDFGLVR